MPYTSLSQIPAAQLPKGFTDPRGFEVRSGADGARLGTVVDLLIDPDRGAHQFQVEFGGRHVLVPFNTAEVDAARRLVQVPGLTQADAARLPAYSAASGAAAPSTTATSAAAQAIASDAVRLVLSEEQLAVGTRAVQAGEVGVRKTVQTERVRRTVPVAREEVTVERRPAVGMDAATAQVEVTDDEIRIPIFGEEVVVEKRLVPAEEYIIRKRQVTETRTVEADLRRERLAVDQAGAVETDSAPAARRPGSGAA